MFEVLDFLIEEERKRTAWRAIDEDTGERIEALTHDEFISKLRDEHNYRIYRIRPDQIGQ